MEKANMSSSKLTLKTLPISNATLVLPLPAQDFHATIMCTKIVDPETSRHKRLILHRRNPASSLSDGMQLLSTFGLDDDDDDDNYIQINSLGTALELIMKVLKKLLRKVKMGHTYQQRRVAQGENNHVCT
jgi:hypothetical protein